MRRALSAIVLASLLTAPTALAVWRGIGDYEPNTPLDTATWMRQGPPGAAKDLIYFNVFMTTNLVATPQSPTAESRVFPAGVLRPMAQLGVWWDCNGDGYIGMADGALLEYPDEVLDAAGKARCPRETYEPEKTGYHNLNGTITELVTIVHFNENDVRADKRLIGDRDTKIWGDNNLPGGDVLGRGSTCGLTIFAKGTLQSTGGLLNHATCSSGRAATYNAVLAGIEARTGQDTDALKAADERDWRTLGMGLGRIQTAGNDDASNANAHIYDCSSKSMLVNESHAIPDTGVQQVDALTGTVTIQQRMPAPSADPAKPFTVAGQVNQTREEATQDCDTTNDGGRDVYVIESEFEPSLTQTPKRAPDWKFDLLAGNGFGGAFGLGGIATILGAPFGVGNGPEEATRRGYHQFTGTAYWGHAGSVGPTGPYGSAARVGVSLDTLQVTGPTVNSSTTWYTFYASVGTNSTAAPRNLKTPSEGVSEGSYGSEWCDTSADWRLNGGYDCDGATWYRLNDGTAAAEKVGRPHPGAPYQLKDHECYDLSPKRGVKVQAIGGTYCDA